MQHKMQVVNNNNNNNNNDNDNDNDNNNKVPLLHFIHHSCVNC